MKISIVATLYHSSPYTSEFHERTSVTAKQLVCGIYEIAFVNDGFPENYLQVALGLG